MAGMFLLALTLLNFFVVLKLMPYLQNGHQDFGVFYRGAEMLRGGEAKQIHDLHPIFEELLFVPFTYVSFRAAYLLWTLVELALMTLSLAILRRMFTEVAQYSWLLMMLAATAFTPAIRAIMQGQDSILLLFFVMVGLWLLTQQDDISAGAVLGLALFKFHIVVPLALLLAVRRPRLLAAFTLVGIAVLMLSVMIVGWHGIAEYVRFVFQLESHGAGGTPAGAMPNIRGLVAQFADQREGGILKALTIFCSIMMFAIAIWWMGRENTSIRQALAIAVVTSIMVSYHTVIHDLTLLLPVVVMLLSAPGTGSRSAMWTDIALLVLVYSSLALGSVVWPSLNPWWWIPIVLWAGRHRRTFVPLREGATS